MSLYRQARDRRRAWIAAAAAGIVAIALAVFLLGGGDGGEGEGGDAADLGPGIERLSSALELVALHYGRSVSDGKVADEALFSSVNDQLEAAADEFESLAPLLTPELSRYVEGSLARLRRLIDERSRAFEVGGEVRRLRSRLGSLSP